MADASPTAAQAGPVESRHAVECAGCGWSLMVPVDAYDECPHCRKTGFLAPSPGKSEFGHPPPELVVGDTIAPDAVKKALAATIARHHLLPDDLRADHLAERLVRWFEPVWLCDLQVRARWQAQGAYLRPLVTTADQLRDGAWSSEPIVSNEIVWSDLVGESNRRYTDVAGRALKRPMLAEAADVTKIPQDRLPWSAASTTGSAWRLPDIPRETAELAALEVVRNLAAAECRIAAGADSIRAFDWAPESTTVGATLLLVPAWSTYYVSESGERYVWHISALTGRVTGKIVRSDKTLRWIAALAAVSATLILGVAIAIPRANDAGGLKAILWLAVIVGTVSLMQLLSSGSEADA